MRSLLIVRVFTFPRIFLCMNTLSLPNLESETCPLGRILKPLWGYVKELYLVAQCNPEASQTFQDNAALRIGNELNGTIAFGCFAPWIYL